MRKNGHSSDCQCGECILQDNEYIIDLSNSIDKDQVFGLNEKNCGDCKTIFKDRENKLDRSSWTESNDGDPELLIYVPFTSQCKVKNMTLIGGEDGSAPSVVKLFVNKENPDFDLSEGGASQVVECQEDPRGERKYNLKGLKFNDVWSITMIVANNFGGENSKIYYVGFEGTCTKNKKRILVGNYEINRIGENVENKAFNPGKEDKVFS